MASRIFLYPYAGPNGKNYIKQQGSLQDIEKLKISLKEGLVLPFYCDDADDAGKLDNLYFEGSAHFDVEHNNWYIIVDETSYRRASTEAQNK